MHDVFTLQSTQAFYQALQIGVVHYPWESASRSDPIYQGKHASPVLDRMTHTSVMHVSRVMRPSGLD